MAGHRTAENRAGMDRTHPMTALPIPPAMVNHHISLARANRRITPAMEMDTRPPMDTRPLTAPLTSPATVHPETNRTTLVKMSRQRAARPPRRLTPIQADLNLG
jgi:hypothetical protein